MTRTVEPPALTRSWTGLHVHLAWSGEHADTFLVGSIAPLMNSLRATGRLADWYFQRDRTHLRLRLRGADWYTVRALRADLTRLATAADFPLVGEHDHGVVRQVAYEPRTEVFGGPGAMPVAEDVFCRSTDLALQVLALAPTKFDAARTVVAATVIALGHGGDTAADPALTRWVNAVQRSRRKLGDDPSEPVAGRWLGVWSAHLNLLLNRLGLDPQEVRDLVAKSPLAPYGPRVGSGVWDD
ncbi:thiopeptide-type bacteriocin biosynthesis protein [Actinokineospora sp. NBRC 105648]|uniref:thiopeptide-type bacteriocin biosynthesis protein n=1 Tax=Actinokineospora sp. NBRC 105648 TaxID=3032206 RepID=UPI0024A36A10|nr:thiopeptide-type bacteriocin biosynthesis protein [Actinokineospora sp. NBRC 105648]GLZ38478.1 hypothetical protein Acsp05_21020 [Actinokineospora sp. NBRC 105648]